MNNTQRRIALWLTAAIMAWCGACRADQTVTVENAWVRPAPPGAAAGAAYLTIRNHSARARILLGVSSPQFQEAEMHLSQITDGQLRMRRLDKIPIAPHGTLEFKPGAYHLMLLRPLRTLKEGDAVELRLHFDGAPAVAIRAPIRESAAEIPDHRGMKMK